MSHFHNQNELKSFQLSVTTDTILHQNQRQFRSSLMTICYVKYLQLCLTSTLQKAEVPETSLQTRGIYQEKEPEIWESSKEAEHVLGTHTTKKDTPLSPTMETSRTSKLD